VCLLNFGDQIHHQFLPAYFRPFFSWNYLLKNVTTLTVDATAAARLSLCTLTGICQLQKFVCSGFSFNHWRKYIMMIDLVKFAKPLSPVPSGSSSTSSNLSSSSKVKAVDRVPSFAFEAVPEAFSFSLSYCLISCIAAAVKLPG
jgi:hypothetical protein